MPRPAAAADRAPAPRRRDRRFPYWFARISRALSQQLLQHVQANFALNLAEYRVLSTLADLRTSSIRDIAADALLDKAQVTRAIAALTGRGLVIQVVDGRDRRLREVKLTPAGRKLIDRTLPFVTARQQRLEQRLSLTEQRALWAALKALSQEAERMLGAELRHGARGKGSIEV